ncbi:MAG: hypothetical protein KDK26_12510 [Roseivivax sp.]|nr:hypothetical protein [Roseivivax sp.]
MPALLACAPALAGGLDMTDAERAAFGAEVRALLRDEPMLVGRALTPDPYAEEKAADHALLEGLAAALFDPARRGWGPPGAPAMVALTAPGCTACAATEPELAALAAARGLRIGLLDITEEPALAAELGLDSLPSYVLPDMLVRGDVPVFVLDGYLAR